MSLRSIIDTLDGIGKKKVILLTVIVPSVFIGLLTLHYSVHVPIWDQWEFVTILQKHIDHTLGFSDFWTQHNEHRILFPRVVMYLLGLVTRWDPYFEVIVNVVLGIMATLIVVISAHRSLKQYPASAVIVGCILAFAILSPIQWENWLWGWQIQWFLSVLVSLVAIHILAYKELSRQNVFIALLCSIIATYSLANGFTVWLLCLIALLLRRAQTRQIISWIVAGTTATGLYYYNYINPAYHPSKTLFLSQPLSFIRYILVYIGKPISLRLYMAVWLGGIVTLIFASSVFYLWKKGKIQDSIFWITLVLYALLGACSTAISRLGFGIEQAFSSRYSTISTLFVVGTIVIGCQAISLYTGAEKHTSSKQTGFLALFLLPFVVLLTMSYAKGIVQMRAYSSTLHRSQTCLQLAQSSDEDCLLLAYPSKQITWERLQFLRSHQLGGFD